ncbi:MAG: hypothetical protein B7Y39_16730 [Bdellovibrio sp. 28-41-41]|nr:MAG: hypothetical protein B7Y39_16730 [Bdellovibrio sp. 28-41-41]
MLPIDMSDFGKWIGYLTFFTVGVSFGAVLEMAGFGDSRKLAAQFYFKDMTVFKTMFTSIIVACLLIFLFSALGLLDFSQIYVNPTYLWPGVVGGLIMGVGFIIGGYCPGTSIVSAASLKIDGMVFLIGTLIGAGLFGETVKYYSDFWNSSFTDRWLLSDWLNWSIGATVVAITVMALILFYFAEKTEALFQDKGTVEKAIWNKNKKTYLASAVVIFLISLFIWSFGQPDPKRKWNIMGAQYQPQLDSREVFIHPLEYVKTWNDANVKLVTLDMRSEDEFKQFHLDSAKRFSLEDVVKKEFVFDLLQLPPQGVVVIVSNTEEEAVRAWQWLKVQGVANLYILENGLNNWNQLFSDKVLHLEKIDLTRPSAKVLELFPKDFYKAKIKLKTTKKGAGLCS